MSATVDALPPSTGPAREAAIASALLGGEMPSWLRTWVPVPVAGVGHTGTIYVFPDYLSIGSDDDFVRMPMAPTTAEQVASSLGGRLPTRKMVNDIHSAASLLAAQPWGPPYDSSMMATQRYIAHNAKIESYRASIGLTNGMLVSGHKKDVVVSPTMDGAHVCIYGWFTKASPSSAIQGPPANCKSHELSYADYSHGIRVVKDTMLVDGQEMLVDDVMRDASLSALVSDNGVYFRTRYSDGAPTGGGGNIPYSPPSQKQPPKAPPKDPSGYKQPATPKDPGQPGVPEPTPDVTSSELSAGGKVIALIAGMLGMAAIARFVYGPQIFMQNRRWYR